MVSLKPVPLFPRGLWNVGWRYLVLRRWQSMLMVLGITLGVAVMVAIDLANASASQAFQLSTESTLARRHTRSLAVPTAWMRTCTRPWYVRIGSEQRHRLFLKRSALLNWEANPLSYWELTHLSKLPSKITWVTPGSPYRWTNSPPS